MHALCLNLSLVASPFAVSNVAPTGTWILATGLWSDPGVWLDSETWID